MASKKIYLDSSFHGKCFVTDYGNGHMILTSYITEVAEIENGNFFRLWEKYSATTMRHVNAFLEYAGYKRLTKKSWEAQPIKAK